MRDVLGWRRKFGVLGPSTNTVVQPDFDMMRPPGVTNHYSRIFTPNAQAVSNESFMAGATVIGNNTLDAVRSVMTCAPDYLVMGMSAVTFFGGAAGADAFQQKIETRIRRRRQHRLAFLHGGAERVPGRHAHRVPDALLSGRERRGAALLHRVRLHGGARHLPAMSELDRHRRGAARSAAQAPDRARRRRRRRDRAGRHQSQHGPTRRRRRIVARQTRDRDQHRDILARAAPQRHR